MKKMGSRSAAQLVRMQMRSFLDQFLDKFSAVAKVAEPTPVVHVLRHSFAAGGVGNGC